MPSDVDPEIPAGCHVTFVQTLSRHGARYPTWGKTIAYRNMAEKIKSDVGSFTGKYAFLKDYNYSLGADELTEFGEESMIKSGTKFYERYQDLARHSTPFTRASGQSRVIMSAQKWIDGFRMSGYPLGLANSTAGKPYDMVIISEDGGANNTLSHGLCNVFETGPSSEIASDAQAKWIEIFVRPILPRLNADLPGAKLSAIEVVYMMDLCPFHTVASSTGRLSRFCNLFTEKEWRQYDYLQTLGKYYGYGYGNPLGPTQGVGFANELIARLTSSPIKDSTSTNRTLDSDPQTFPLDRTMYADFSHDNVMTSIFAALGLYNSTPPLSNTSIETVEHSKGYSAAWTVPFGARAYFEKLSCAHEKEELVRVLINDRVLPLEQCGGDRYGRCKLSAFVDSLDFARGDGRWDECSS